MWRWRQKCQGSLIDFRYLKCLLRITLTIFKISWMKYEIFLLCCHKFLDLKILDLCLLKMSQLLMWHYDFHSAAFFDQCTKCQRPRENGCHRKILGCNLWLWRQECAHTAINRLNFFGFLIPANETWIWIAQIVELQKSFEFIPNSN